MTYSPIINKHLFFPPRSLNGLFYFEKILFIKVRVGCFFSQSRCDNCLAVI